MCPSHVTLTLFVQGHTVFYVYLCIYVCSFPIMLPLCNPVIPPLAVSCRVSLPIHRLSFRGVCHTTASDLFPFLLVTHCKYIHVIHVFAVLISDYNYVRPHWVWLSIYISVVFLIQLYIGSSRKTRGPKGNISCTWVQSATFFRNRPGRPFLFTDPPEKYKLGRGRRDLASCQVSLNSVQRFQSGRRKCVSLSEARAAILLFQ